MLVRRARHDDAEAIADVFVASLRGLTFLPVLHPDEETRDWVQSTMIPTHEVWVAETDGGVAGFAAFSGDLLGHLYVRPERQRRGIGTALFDVVGRERPAGFRLWVFQQNTGARRFYERLGCRLLQLTDGSGNEEGEPDALYEWRP